VLVLSRSIKHAPACPKTNFSELFQDLGIRIGEKLEPHRKGSV